MRFHAIQNVETALRFLRYKEIKLVNIRGEDIVDGNPKLTLGLIWTIILHFQVSLPLALLLGFIQVLGVGLLGMFAVSAPPSMTSPNVVLSRTKT